MGERELLIATQRELIDLMRRQICLLERKVRCLHKAHQMQTVTLQQFHDDIQLLEGEIDRLNTDRIQPNFSLN